MPMFKGFAILSSGMTAQRTRMHLVASNLANAHTTRTEEGGAYKRQDPIFRTALLEAFGEVDPSDEGLRGVEVSEVVEDETPGPLVYDPSHPDADANGNVQMPNVNVVEEMINLTTAQRSFEANVQSFQALRDMISRSIDLGR